MVIEIFRLPAPCTLNAHVRYILNVLADLNIDARSCARFERSLINFTLAQPLLPKGMDKSSFSFNPEVASLSLSDVRKECARISQALHFATVCKCNVKPLGRSQWRKSFILVHSFEYLNVCIEYSNIHPSCKMFINIHRFAQSSLLVAVVGKSHSIRHTT